MTNKPEMPKYLMQGLGNDIIEIERIRKNMEQFGAHFLDRLFTAKEQAYCNKFQDSAPHYAGRFAAKEAIAKAFGTGFGAELAWCDIEILPDELGKPIANFSPTLQAHFHYPTVLISISHNNSQALATAIWVA